jgi:adenosylcobinamide-phosphate synthase
MGWVINLYTQRAWHWWQRPWQLRLAGIALGLSLIIGSGGLSWVMIQITQSWSASLGVLLQIIMLASCLAGRSLRAAAEDVLAPLAVNDLEAARLRLSHYVGRDTDQLSQLDILRAILETVAENTTDGVMAPMFYALIGWMIPGFGPVPLAFAYKAASTLDSMVGYREPPFTDIGWFSARVEDTLTWLPCRLTVVTLGVISGQLYQVLRICGRDAPQDPSPNAGWSECAYAAILGVQLGGMNWYRGVLKSKPLLGNPGPPITRDHIELALRLTRNSFLLWLVLAIVLKLTV